MKRFKYEFWVNDNFETGDCSNCPFEQWEWYDDDGYNDCYSYCAIDSVNKCPLVEVKNDEMVYCTHCKWFRLCDEEIPYCIFEDKCDINDCEDSRHKEDRPYYEERLI